MISLKKILLEAAPAKFKFNSEQTIDNLKKGETVVNTLKDLGFEYTAAIALAGNMSVESMVSGEWFTTTATDKVAYGICQWQAERLTALRAFAKYKGTAASSLTTQLQFVKFELKDGYLLYPNDKNKKIKEQLIPGIPVNLVYIVDGKGNPSVPRHFTEASTETKKFNISNRGTIKDTTSALTTNVFRPSQPHVDRRISNALAIHNYMSGNIPPKQTANNEPTETNELVHVVAKDETLGGIANRNNTTVDNLLKLNPGLSADKIQIGQKIKLK